MISSHTYTAVLIGSPDRPLALKGGQISLDDQRAPHVEATIRIAPPTIALLAALDPRLGVRVRVTATALTPSGVQVRSFDLGLRDRQMSHRNGEVTLEAASDEALLGDYAPTIDDLTLFNFQTSLRAIVGYALGKIGAVLEATPSNDATAQTYADATNIIANGAARSDTVGYNGTGNVSRLTGQTVPDATVTTGTRITKTGADTGGIYYGQMPITPGKTYTASAWVRSSVAKTVRLSVEQATSGGASAGANIHGPAVTLVANTWTRISVTFTAYPTGTSLGVYSYLTTGAWASGNTYDITGIRVSEPTGDPTDLSFFDRFTTAAGGYTYAADGAGSAHKRTATITRPVDALRWPAGRSALALLAPLVQAAGLRLVCDENRKWTLRPTGYYADGSLSIAHAVNLVDATDTLRRTDEWFDAQVTVYTWTDPATGARREAVDSFALVTPPTRVNRVELRDTPYPGPGRSEYAVRRAQGRGREVRATIVADWRATAEQPLEIVLEGAPTQTGQTGRVVFDLDQDELTVTGRTTDTLAGAWVLIPVGQTWLSQPVGGSWIGEVV